MPSEPVPPIPDDLRVLYDLARLSGESNIQILIERIARLDWTPITAENMPKVGDEVLDRSFSDPDEFMITIVAHDWDARQLNPALAGYQFRRPIAAPAGESLGVKK